MSRIAVIGSGAWGTALALSLHRSGHRNICLWSHSTATSQAIAAHRENTRFLPGFSLPGSIRSTTSLSEAAREAAIILTVMPSHHVRAVVSELAAEMTAGQTIVSATKGIETHSGLRVSEIIAQELAAAGRANPVAVLSGPSFAQEVASGQPTAVALAVPPETGNAEQLRSVFLNDSLRVYTTGDLVGVEIGGALKNVIAIASGIVAGLDLGSNSAAALITRGLAEITRLAVACGGRPETMAGLAGMGDLVLTATGGLSRNRAVGVALGQGQKLPEILSSMAGKVAEGVETTRAALSLAAIRNVEMPITEQVADILFHGKEPILAIRELMSRPGRGEFR